MKQTTSTLTRPVCRFPFARAVLERAQVCQWQSCQSGRDGASAESRCLTDELEHSCRRLPGDSQATFSCMPPPLDNKNAVETQEEICRTDTSFTSPRTNQDACKWFHLKYMNQDLFSFEM